MMASDLGKQSVSGQSAMQKAGVVPVPLNARIRWIMRRWFDNVGWLGVAAIGLLVVCLLWYFSALRPMQQHLNDVRGSVAELRERTARGDQANLSSMRSPAEQLAEFYRAFPAERYSPQWLEKLIAIAQQNNLVLNEGEYKTTREKVGRLVRYQIILPVRGQYPQIREFLAAIPAEIPIIALENVEFERENISADTVQARIRLVLYLEQAS